MDNNELQSTNKLLKVIVALMLRDKDEKSLTLRQRIEVLNGLGLKPIEIAEILGKTGTHINKELTGIRKSQKQKK